MFAGQVLAVQAIVILEGHVIRGAALSLMMIVCKQVLELPQSSVACQVLLMVYSCVQIPATVTSVNAMVGEISQRSKAVAVPVFAGNVLSVQRIVIFIGQVITGGAESLTTIV